MKCDNPFCQICNENNFKDCTIWLKISQSWTQSIALDGWNIQGGNGLAYNCGGIEILGGGVNNFGGNAILFKTFENLPPHYYLKVKVQIWKIDSWDNEEFLLDIDEIQFNKIFYYGNGVKICGGDVGDEYWKEEIVNFEIDTQHTSSNVKVQMKSTLDEDPSNESWGVRDFQLFIATCWKGCKSCSGPYQANCLTCQVGYKFINNKCQQQSKIIVKQVVWITINRSFFNNDQDDEGWLIKNGYQTSDNEIFSSCGSAQLFGGFLQFGFQTNVMRKFNLPKHNFLKLKLEFWAIDSWDDWEGDGEQFQIFIDNQLVFHKVYGEYNKIANICGNEQYSHNGEHVDQIDITLPHSTPTAQLVMNSTLSDTVDNESWGFREFQILYNFEEECIELYSECDFKGEKFELCREETKYLHQLGQIKSYKIPIGAKVKLQPSKDLCDICCPKRI